MHSSIVVSDKMLVFGGLAFATGLVDDFFFINTVTIRSGVTEKYARFTLVVGSLLGVGLFM